MDHAETNAPAPQRGAPTATVTGVGVESQREAQRAVGPYRRPAFALGAGATGALAVGALAFGAMAIGALAVGRLAIGRLVIGKSRLRSLDIEELSVKRLRVGELLMTRAKNSGGK
ncbi:MAG: hypothetical protein ACJ8KA_13335 [Sulfurifustis sp.]